MIVTELDPCTWVWSSPESSAAPWNSRNILLFQKRTRDKRCSLPCTVPHILESPTWMLLCRMTVEGDNLEIVVLNYFLVHCFFLLEFKPEFFVTTETPRRLDEAHEPVKVPCSASDRQLFHLVQPCLLWQHCSSQGLRQG